jgi:hypothetical protein
MTRSKEEQGGQEGGMRRMREEREEQGRGTRMKKW